MSSNNQTGGSAFPHPGGVSFGMTLRDYFAARAMEGILSSPHWAALPDPDSIAERAYNQADAMLRAREVK